MQSTWCLIEQLVKTEPPPRRKKTAAQKKVPETFMVSQVVRKVENSAMSLNDAAKVRLALAGRSWNDRLTLCDLEKLVITANLNRAQFRKVLGLK